MALGPWVRPSAAVALVALVTLPFLLIESEKDHGGLRVEVVVPSLLSEEPLGDVVRRELRPGTVVRVLCWVERAQTNGGFYGSAVRVRVDEVEGYAPVTTFEEDESARRPVFDPDVASLRDRLPRCPG